MLFIFFFFSPTHFVIYPCPYSFTLPPLAWQGETFDKSDSVPNPRLHNDVENKLSKSLDFIFSILISGKSTGIVTNTRITHATPSALYAHSPSRYWEDDGKVPTPSRKSCKDIARQLVEDDPGRYINVSVNHKTLHELNI